MLQKCVHRGGAKEPARESIFSKRKLLQGARWQGLRTLRGDGDGEEKRVAHRLEALASVPLGRAATLASVNTASDDFFSSLRQRIALAVSSRRHILDAADALRPGLSSVR